MVKAGDLVVEGGTKLGVAAAAAAAAEAVFSFVEAVPPRSTALGPPT